MAFWIGTSKGPKVTGQPPLTQFKVPLPPPGGGRAVAFGICDGWGHEKFFRDDLGYSGALGLNLARARGLADVAER